MAAVRARLGPVYEWRDHTRRHGRGSRARRRGAPDPGKTAAAPTKCWPEGTNRHALGNRACDGAPDRRQQDAGPSRQNYWQLSSGGNGRFGSMAAVHELPLSARSRQSRVYLNEVIGW